MSGRHRLLCETTAGAGDTTNPAPAVPSPRGLDLESALRGLGRTGWTLWIFGPRTLPDAIAAVRPLAGGVDVLVLRAEGRAGAYRAPTGPGKSPFDAREVIWSWQGDPRNVLYALLRLGDLPWDLPRYPTPEDCRPPDSAVRTLTIRPPQ